MQDERAVVTVEDTDFEQVPGGVGADEHRETIIEILDKDRIGERMEHVVVPDAVLAGGCGDRRASHPDKLAWNVRSSQGFSGGQVGLVAVRVKLSGTLVALGGVSQRPSSLRSSHGNRG